MKGGETWGPFCGQRGCTGYAVGRWLPCSECMDAAGDSREPDGSIGTFILVGP